MKSARDEILAVIQRKLPAPSVEKVPPVRLEFPKLAREELVTRFVKEAQALGVKTFVADDAAAAREYLQRLASEKGGEAVVARRPVVNSLGLDGARFHPLGSFPAQDAAISITQADYALADTGTLVMFASDGEGRTLSLLAPVNACVVPASRILSGLAELFVREPAVAERTSAMVLVTGPSRTGDIELTLTVGVHGPGELHAIVLANS